MAKDLFFEFRYQLDGSGANASSFPAEVRFRIEENSVEVNKYLTLVSDMFLSCDVENNGFFIYYQNHKLYQWTAGDTIAGGAAPADASDFYDAVMAILSGA